MRLLFISIVISFFFNCLFSQKLTYPINIEQGIEYYPAISIDGKTLIFISTKEGKNLMYQSTLKNDSIWGEPFGIESINSFNESESYLRDPSISYDGQVLYFSAKYPDSKGGFDIYYSKKIVDTWGTPVNIGEPINSSKDEESCSISGDNKLLYFTRDYANPEYTQFKCRQIFNSVRKEDGTWSEPKILPNPINEGCEATAWICADNNSLFISSVREGTESFDLYFTKLISRDVWIIPIPVTAANNEMHELHPSVSSKGDYLYFHRKEISRKKLESSIYKVKLTNEFKPLPTVTIEGKIFNLNSQAPLLATVKVSDPNTSSFIISLESNPSNGSYKFILNQKKKYLFEFLKDGYSYDYFILNEKDTDTSYITKDIFMFPTVDLVLNVFDEEIFEPLKSDFQILDSSFENEIQTKIKEDQTGRYRINLPIGKNYNIISQSSNFISDTLAFKLTDKIQYNEFERDIELRPLKEEFEINVSDIETDSLMDVEIVITNLEKDEVIIAKPELNEEGKYVIKLRKGDKYEVNVKSPKGYAYYNTTIDMESDKAKEKLDVKLTPLKARTKITLNNITYETNSADLNATSFGELDRVVKLMLDNPDIKIEISAHTDDIGSDKYNVKLSDKRAQTVVDYLKNNKIEKDRLIAKGYGESAPLVPNTSEENRAQNRRVELKVVDIKENTE